MCPTILNILYCLKKKELAFETDQVEERSRAKYAQFANRLAEMCRAGQTFHRWKVVSTDLWSEN